MRVILRLSWFGPNGTLYERDTKRGTEIPDQFCERDADGKWKLLPSTTKPFSAVVAQAADKPQSLRDADGERAAAEAEGAVRELAELEDAVVKAATPDEKKAATLALKRYKLQQDLKNQQ